ncbi:hypothetical protein KPL70_025857 [Citrus sinensis]|nr:hypothetical protein KPL70_025857 [Citrus sinensis]
MYCCQNLTKVTVWSCDCLKYLFSYFMVNSLGQLQHLEIGACGSMEGVVNTTGLGGRDELKVFTKLHSLRLHCLPKVCSFTSPEDVIHTEMQPQPLFDEKVRLPSLEVLHISSMDKLRKIWDHASKSFSKLKNLEISGCHNLLNIFPPLVGIPGSLVNLNVSYCEKIEEIVGHVGEEVKENRIAFSELKLLKLDDLPRLTSFFSMTGCPNMKIFSQGISSTPRLYKVQVTKKEEGELNYREGNLNSTIQKCYKEIVGFRDLQNLKLSDFPRLRELWHGPALPVGFFNNLDKLVVDDCTKMLSAIPSNLLRCLNDLNSLEVMNCDSLEEVLHLEELNAEEEHFGPLFPLLLGLIIMDLPNLKRFYNFTGNILELPRFSKINIRRELLVEFPNLRFLKLSRLHKLQKIVPSLWHLENLMSLEVSKCNGLINVLTISTSKSRVDLKIMKIADCKMIEEIIQSQVGEETKDCIVFKKLKYLTLDCLPSLTSFCSGNCTLQFPSLKQLNKVKLIEEEDDDEVDDDDKGCWEGNLNDTIKNLFNEMNFKEEIEPNLQVE